MSVFETILFAGWLIPVIFIGIFAIYVTTVFERKQAVKGAGQLENQPIQGISGVAGERSMVSQRAA